MLTFTIVLFVTYSGADHLKYGVRPSFLSSMGQALILALADTLGDKWTPAYEASWRLFYDELSADMVASMFEAQQAKVQTKQAKIDKKNGDDHSRMSTRTSKSRDSTRTSKSRDSTRSGKSSSERRRSERKGRRREKTTSEDEKASESETKQNESDHSEKENCQREMHIEI